MQRTKTLPVYWDPIFLKHRPPDGSFNLPPMDLVAKEEPHPDKPERVENIRHVIAETLSEYVRWKTVEPASKAQVAGVHDRELLVELEAFCANGGGRLELAETTGANEFTYDAAMHAAGAAIQAAEQTLESGIDHVPYALVRPSGHHAQPNQMDGFCYFNNIAVAANQIREPGEVERIAIIDWDVHHGNGTQEVFYDRDDVLVVSLHANHRSWGDSHPQTGLPEENGTGPGRGYNVNIPLPPGTGTEGYTYAFQRIVEPVVTEFDPDVILVSAGQDAGMRDPLARNVATKETFVVLGTKVRELAATCSDGNLAVVQEGGYQPSHLGFLTLGVLEGVLDIKTGTEDPFRYNINENRTEAITWIHQAGEAAATFWPVPFRD